MNANITIKELLQLWHNGKKAVVLEHLQTDHPGLTAMFITSGSQYENISLRLTVADCNTITNMLMDRRVKLIQEPQEQSLRYIGDAATNIEYLATLIENDNVKGVSGQLADMRAVATEMNRISREF